MGLVALAVGVTCVIVLAYLVVTCVLRGGAPTRQPGTFTFGANRHMQCACPLCKERTQPRSQRATPNRAPSSGRRLRRALSSSAGGMSDFQVRKRVAVIGAGPAGASAARQLAERGHTVVVFEAADDVGGRTFTLRAPYHQFDSGAGFFTDFYPLFRHYVEGLNLTGQILSLRRFNKCVSQVTGRSYNLKLAFASLLQHPFVGFVSKLRCLAFSCKLWFKRHALDLVDPAMLAKLDDTSVTLAATSALGFDAYHNIVRPLMECFWFFSCVDTSAALLHSLASKAPTAKFFTMAGGMDIVVRRLLTHPNILVRCSSPATKVSKNLRVTYGRHGVAGVDKFEAIIIATTADQALKLVQSDKAHLSGLVSAEMLSFLQSQRYASSVHGAFTIDKSEMGRLDSAVTTVMPCGQGVWSAAAVSLTSHKILAGTMPSDSEGVQVYLMDGASKELQKQYPRQEGAGARGDDVPERPGHAHPTPTQGLSQHVWQRGRELMPELPSSAICVAVFSRKNAIPIPEVGRYRLAVEADKSQRAPIVFCGDYLATSTVEGAMRSGMRAALLIHDSTEVKQ